MNNGKMHFCLLSSALDKVVPVTTALLLTRVSGPIKTAVPWWLGHTTQPAKLVLTHSTQPAAGILGVI